MLEELLEKTAEPKLDEYLFILRVTLKGKRTSISLDNVIVKLLTKKLGSKDAVQKWLQGAVDEISLDFPNEKPSAGYSRIVQQKAIMLIVDPLLLANN